MILNSPLTSAASVERAHPIPEQWVDSLLLFFFLLLVEEIIMTHAGMSIRAGLARVILNWILSSLLRA
jgi:hypothetical protein